MPATYVARILGRHPRTVRRWIDSGEVGGLEIAGRHYVYRSAFEELRDPHRNRKKSAA